MDETYGYMIVDKTTGTILDASNCVFVANFRIADDDLSDSEISGIAEEHGIPLDEFFYN